MFKNLIHLGFKRTSKQAVGFYLAYFFLSLIAVALVGGVVGLVMGEMDNAFEVGIRVGNIMAIVITLILSFSILKEKKLLNNFKYIVIALLSGIVALFTGVLGGLIPVAYLTTKAIHGKKK